MSVKYLCFWIALLVLLASCSDLSPDGTPGIEVSPTAVRGVLATVGIDVVTPGRVLPTVTQTFLVPTVIPTATENLIRPAAETTSPPAKPLTGFSGLHFAPAMDAPSQSTFPAGTEEVYVVWDYSGMSPTDKVRRIWFRDDQIWLTREEGWNWEEYDSEGTIRDISVYDNEGSGLKPATYRLQLYVNDELQQEATFIIQAP